MNCQIHEKYMKNTWKNTYEIHMKYMGILPVSVASSAPATRPTQKPLPLTGADIEVLKKQRRRIQLVVPLVAQHAREDMSSVSSRGCSLHVPGWEQHHHGHLGGRGTSELAKSRPTGIQTTSLKVLVVGRKCRACVLQHTPSGRWDGERLSCWDY